MKITATIEAETSKPLVVWDKDASGDIGADVREMIITRTAEGRDASGSKFAPYSPESVEDKGTTRVTLRITGAMLGSIKVSSTKDGAVVTVGTDYAKYVDRMRPFMGLTEAETGEVFDAVDAICAARIARATKGASSASRPLVGG